MTFPSPFPPPRRHPDRRGQHFPALVSLSAGRVVEGSWQDRSATQLDVTQPTDKGGLKRGLSLNEAQLPAAPPGGTFKMRQTERYLNEYRSSALFDGAFRSETWR
jgi:hypothetical protein